MYMTHSHTISLEILYGIYKIANIFERKRNMTLLSSEILGQSGNMLLEELLCLLPDTGVGSVLEL
jgi:hypothetical protein